MASNAFSSPSNLLLPTAIIALWQRLYSCPLKLGNEIPGFLPNLSYYHVLSIAHGRAKYTGHPAKELTWLYAACRALALFFTDLDSGCYLNQRRLTVWVFMFPTMSPPTQASQFQKQICSGWKQMCSYNTTLNNSYKLILVFLLLLVFTILLQLPPIYCQKSYLYVHNYSLKWRYFSVAAKRSIWINVGIYFLLFFPLCSLQTMIDR